MQMLNKLLLQILNANLTKL